jgi:CheY-like chemotaxis protein
MDLNMPEMDGFECLTHLKGLNLSKEFKLIVVSTSNSKRDIQKAKSLGAESYIVKPFSITEYTQLLTEHLN